MGNKEEEEEEDNEAESHIAFLYSQLELKRRQIQRIEADLSDGDVPQEEEEDERDDGDDCYKDEYDDVDDDDGNDGVMLMDENDMNALRGDDEDEDEEEELVFDPILQCFYSPRTNMYYEKE